MKSEYRIIPELVAQGSYGVRRKNPLTGQQAGGDMRVWHVLRAGERIGTFPTRKEARVAQRLDQRRTAEAGDAS